MGGHSHPRPRSADRHRRSAGRGATASAPAAWTAGAVSGRTTIPCPATLEVNRTRRNRHRNPLPAVITGPPYGLAERHAVKPSITSSEGAAGSSTSCPGSCPRPSNPRVRRLRAGRRGGRRRSMGRAMCGAGPGNPPTPRRARATGRVLPARTFTSMKWERPAPPSRTPPPGTVRRVSSAAAAAAAISGGLEGARPPARPLRGTHGVWPRRVGWLTHLKSVGQPSAQPLKPPLSRRPAWPVPGDPDLASEAVPPGVFGGHLTAASRASAAAGSRPLVPGSQPTAGEF